MRQARVVLRECVSRGDRAYQIGGDKNRVSGKREVEPVDMIRVGQIGRHIAPAAEGLLMRWAMADPPPAGHGNVPFSAKGRPAVTRKTQSACAARAELNRP